MPRKLISTELTTGHGKAAPDENAARPSLTGAGLAGAGPNIGQPVVPAGSVLGGATTGEAFAGHVQDPKGAHAASAIEHNGYPDILISHNVEGALDELIGTVVKRPPFIGQWDPSTTFSGIPDWGFLKLRDDSLTNYPLSGPPAPLANLPQGADPADVFPYYFSAPGPAQDAEFVNEGGDPRTDWIWNTGLELTGMPNAPGMGYGRSHIGGFTRGGDAGPDPLEVMRTARLYPRPTANDPETGVPFRVPVTISGAIFPADRGVLALFHFPPSLRGNMKLEFLGQPLITDETAVGGPQGRVVAALLLGTGILGDKCSDGTPCSEEHPCDGDPGGIFTTGVDPVTGQYNPFAFPGRASGQYDLDEIHLGTDGTANDLRAPWNDLDGDMVTGAKRTATATLPAPGQVRLGTDPDAGETPVDYGIPILGGTLSYFDADPGPQNGSLGYSIKGDTLLHWGNFFRYRLPVLKDYSQATGLKWTPRGDAGITTQETIRYFERASPYSPDYPDGTPLSGNLRTAGFYEAGFDEDYWVWQIARYRHSFLMPSIEGSGLREEVGSYWLVHFKHERDFEKFARDGIFPWDVNDGYEVYGYTLMGAPPVHIEEDKNIVNDWAFGVPPVSPHGAAPEFGYSADPYHGLRSTILLDPAGTALPAVAASEYTWATTSDPGVDEAVMWVSGVAYLTARKYTADTFAFFIPNIDLSLAPGFWTSYRTNQDDLTNGVQAPAILASVNPMFLNLFPLAYSGSFGVSTMTVTVGPPGIGLVSGAQFLNAGRIEVPFEYLGSNGSGYFSDANGPLDVDPLQLTSPGMTPLATTGDVSEPSFSRDAKIRAYFRRPLNHTADDTTTLPFTANDGHGQVLTPMDGKRILFHSTHFSSARVGDYGNYLQNALGGVLPNTSFVELFNPADKNIWEKFLDETYRIYTFAPYNGHGPYNAVTVRALYGPGLQGWVGGPIEVPVRIGYSGAPLNECSWLLMERHVVDLTGTSNLQVAGLPDRNPPQSAAVQMPFPSAGMLVYPQEDFSGVKPEAAVEYAGAAQRDYSAAAAGTRTYIRAFDAAFSHLVPALAVAGTTSVVLRIDGLTLADIRYAIPGPGGLNDDRVAIEIKVPGLTTWMDVGRPDGGGPSKQDMFLDGAGCMVVGDETYDFQDPETGYVGCYIKVHLGPVATLFLNLGVLTPYAAGDAAGEAPVLVRVRMTEGVRSRYDLEHRYLGGGAFEGFAAPGAAPNSVRGLFGIRLVHPSDVLVAP